MGGHLPHLLHAHALLGLPPGCRLDTPGKSSKSEAGSPPVRLSVMLVLKVWCPYRVVSRVLCQDWSWSCICVQKVQVVVHLFLQDANIRVSRLDLFPPHPVTSQAVTTCGFEEEKVSYVITGTKAFKGVKIDSFIGMSGKQVPHKKQKCLILCDSLSHLVT